MICMLKVNANILVGRMKYCFLTNASSCTTTVVESFHLLLKMGWREDESFGLNPFLQGKEKLSKMF